MRHPIQTVIPALALGLVLPPNTHAATPATAFANGMKVAEAALTLNEVAKLLFDVGSLSGDRARIKVALELASWSRRVEGAYRGTRYLQSFNYRYYPVQSSALYITQRLQDGRIVTDNEPFTVTTLENRDYRCVRNTSKQADWEVRRANFTLAARSTVLEQVGLFANGLGPWTCTVVASRSPMPSDCQPAPTTESQVRRSISVSTGGRTYFNFDRTGNHLYGIPEILIGGQGSTGPAVVVPNPERQGDAQNDPVRTSNPQSNHQ